ncbi:hypothetical protein EVA_14148 [gut metagenome]|uniref:Uncharacterized protein n=1 Tax=gut metagenome TaxID=749906 RepID=J9G7I8_9ZZZZ
MLFLFRLLLTLQCLLGLRLRFLCLRLGQSSLSAFFHRLDEALLHGGRSFLDGIGRSAQLVHTFLVDFLAFRAPQVFQQELFRYAKLGEVFYHLLPLCLQVKRLTQCHLLHAFNNLFRHRLGHNLQHRVAESNRTGCIARHDLHILRVGLAILVRDAAFHLHAHGKVRLQVVTDALSRHRAPVVADNARLYPEVPPCPGNNLRHAHRQSLNRGASALTATAKHIEAVSRRVRVHRCQRLNHVEHLRQLTGELLSRSNLHVNFAAVHRLQHISLLHLNNFLLHIHY